MLFFALYIAGFFLLLREVLPWLRARSSGVVHTRGHRRTVVERDVEPERYALLMHNRVKAMLPGGIILLVAVTGTVWAVLSVMLPTY